MFASGEYNGAEFKPLSPEQALRDAGADGTRSILDILRIAPARNYGCAAPFSEQELDEYFGTDKPTIEDIDDSDLWDAVDRGQARYIVVYEGSEPKQICFMGYSFD